MSFVESNVPASPRPGDPPPAPPVRKSFLKRLLFWMFCFQLPAAVAVGTLAVYVHEFSHGLTALATGGYFLGIKMQPSTRRESTMAYADAWSPDYENLVILAGITVNVILGLLLLWQAFRCERIVPRLLLFLCAGAFLGDLEYALEGCVFWESDFDTARVLQSVGSPVLRWTLLALLLPTFILSVATVGRGLFRTWEQVFGALSGGKAFWVAVLLSASLSTPSHRGANAWIGFLGAGAAYVLLVTWLVKTRRQSVEPTPVGRFAGWGIGLAVSAVVAAGGLIFLYKGLPLGTYPDNLVYDLHPDRKAVVGISARFGMGDRQGRYRPEHDPQLFISTPEGSQTFPFHTDHVVDVTWLPSLDRLVVVGWNGVYEVDRRSGKESVVWKPPNGWIEHGGHGPDGQILVILRSQWGKLDLLPGLYVYDANRSFGEFYEADGKEGSPVFLHGLPVRAAVTIGEDLWEVTWPHDDDGEIRVERRKGVSKGSWFHGLSGESSWWYDGEGWFAGSTRVSDDNFAHWGAGAEGFFTLKEKGGWELTVPGKGRVRNGPIETSSVKHLQFLDGVPWVVLRNGDVRRLESEVAEFRVRYPRPSR